MNFGKNNVAVQILCLHLNILTSLAFVSLVGIFLTLSASACDPLEATFIRVCVAAASVDADRRRMKSTH